MRPDPDACRDPDLLAAEVRRLRAVIDSGKPVLTDAEREAVEESIEANEAEADLFNCEVAKKHAAALRGLLERTT